MLSILRFVVVPSDPISACATAVETSLPHTSRPRRMRICQDFSLRVYTSAVLDSAISSSATLRLYTHSKQAGHS
jgi:hypothetical protein